MCLSLDAVLNEVRYLYRAFLGFMFSNISLYLCNEKIHKHQSIHVRGVERKSGCGNSQVEKESPWFKNLPPHVVVMCQV